MKNRDNKHVKAILKFLSNLKLSTKIVLLLIVMSFVLYQLFEIGISKYPMEFSEWYRQTFVDRQKIEIPKAIVGYVFCFEITVINIFVIGIILVCKAIKSFIKSSIMPFKNDFISDLNAYKLMFFEEKKKFSNKNN